LSPLKKFFGNISFTYPNPDVENCRLYDEKPVLLSYGSEFTRTVFFARGRKFYSKIAEL
jgi:hypothetical protein